MLRITIHEDDKACRLELAGRLEGPWVLETEYAWRSLLRLGRQIELDMRQLTRVDDAGRELLSAMHLAGVRLIVEGVWMKSLIEEITGEQPLRRLHAEGGGERGFPLAKVPRSGEQQMKINSVLKLKHVAWASGALVAAILVNIVTHARARASVQASPAPMVEVAAVEQRGRSGLRRMDRNPHRAGKCRCESASHRLSAHAQL